VLLLDADNPADLRQFGPPEDPASARSLGVKLAVVAPMPGRTAMVGVLAAGQKAGRGWLPEDVRFVTSVARLAALAVENIRALHGQRQAVQRLERAARVAAALNVAEDVTAIAEAGIEAAADELGAADGLLYLLDDRGQRLELVASLSHAHRLDVGLAVTGAAACTSRPLPPERPPVVWGAREEVARHHPFVAQLDGLEDRTVVAVPLQTGGAVLGVALWGLERPRALSEDDVDFVELLAEQVVAGLTRARASSAQRTASENLRLLDAELASSRARLQALVGAEVIGIVAGEDRRIIEANRAFLDLVGLDERALGRGGGDWFDLTPPEWHGDDERVLREMRLGGRAQPFEKELLHADGSRVPVLVGGARLGSEPFRWIVYVADLRARRTAEQQARAAEERLEALLEEQRHVATVLQRSLLPPALPDIGGFEVAAHYWAEGEGISVGGDFYDVLPLDRGRYALFVGDVCGKGVEAAATTATVRHTARAAAKHLSQPEAVLGWVHDALAALDSDTFCTVAYAVVETTHPPFIDVALAGHPAGILVRADGSVTDVGQPGTLLGTAIAPSLSARRYALQAGDLVAFYTDGITDAPGSAAMSHDQLGAWLAAQARQPLQAIGDALHRELERRRPHGLHDDVALILLRAQPTPPGG
jgi:sigma-B regulation protein RsbU (phosphoserine phosphatase)